MILIFKALNLMVQDIHAGEFDFSSSITLAETYDDNIYLDERYEDTEDDIITSVSPGFVLSYLTQKSSLTTSYNPEFLFYSKNPEENGVNHSATLDFTSRLTREMSLNVTDSLSFIPAQDITGRELGARDVPSDEIHNSFSTILSYQIFDPTLLRRETQIALSVLRDNMPPLVGRRRLERRFRELPRFGSPMRSFPTSLMEFQRPRPEFLFL